jgi:hypothetical protein
MQDHAVLEIIFESNLHTDPKCEQHVLSESESNHPLFRTSRAQAVGLALTAIRVSSDCCSKCHRNACTQGKTFSLSNATLLDFSVKICLTLRRHHDCNRYVHKSTIWLLTIGQLRQKRCSVADTTTHCQAGSLRKVPRRKLARII